MDFIKWPYRKRQGNKAYGSNSYSENLTYLKKMVTMRYEYLVKTWK